MWLVVGFGGGVGAMVVVVHVPDREGVGAVLFAGPDVGVEEFLAQGALVALDLAVVAWGVGGDALVAGRVLAVLQTRADADGLIVWDVSVDSTVMRAHQHAAGARKEGDLQVEPRGGWTSRLHLACEQRRRPLSPLVTAGQRGDSPQFVPVIEAIRVPRPDGGRPRTRPDRVLADKAYSSEANRAYLRRRGIKATIDQPRDQATIDIAAINIWLRHS